MNGASFGSSGSQFAVFLVFNRNHVVLACPRSGWERGRVETLMGINLRLAEDSVGPLGFL